MKRVFVLDTNWFDNHREDIEALESALMSLKLVDAQEQAGSLMNAALEEEAGIRLAGYELDWLIQKAIAEDPEVVILLSQCHLDADHAAELCEWLDSLSESEVPDKLTPSIRELTEVLSTDRDFEVLLLEDEPGLELQFGAAGQADESPS